VWAAHTEKTLENAPSLGGSRDVLPPHYIETHYSSARNFLVLAPNPVDGFSISCEEALDVTFAAIH
jgi:hypothetical protein